MNTIALLGAEGNMGKRYTCILNCLGKKVIPIDLETPPDVRKKALSTSDGVIVSTPTDQHLKDMNEVMDLNPSRPIPMLCEKPLSKDIQALNQTITRLKSFYQGNPGYFAMVFQYLYAYQGSPVQLTEYNYYHSGSDGLYWDCIQLIGLATGGILLSNQSPIWRCNLNGVKIDRASLDGFYIQMIQDWLKGTHGFISDDLDQLYQLHQKVISLMPGAGNG